MSAIWQISGGTPSGPIAAAFLAYGVALVGVGGDDAELEDAVVRRFREEVAEGNAILLRSAGGELLAVGLIAGAYEWLPQFDDVGGRALPHARRVRWARLPAPYALPDAGLGKRRFSAVMGEEARRYVDQFIASPPFAWQRAPLPALPAEEPQLDDVPPRIADLAALACDLVPLYDDRTRFVEAPSENETVAHFVVPLLRALGWPPDRIALEWRNIDVALFRPGPRTPDRCALVVEAKRLGAPVESALGQAQGYLTGIGSERDIIVTDGIRYRAYAAARGHASVAYANLARLKRSALALFDFLSPKD